MMAKRTFPEVITLCGSTRFKEEYLEVQKRLTLSGKIVLSVGLFNHAENERLTDEQENMMDELHLRRIDLSNGIYVIDVGGYIEPSIRNEIEYATSQNKSVRYYSREFDQAVS